MSWQCLSCHRKFEVPAFSEGPKTWDPDKQKVERFQRSHSCCPHCFSIDIKPDERTLRSKRGGYLRRSRPKT